MCRIPADKEKNGFFLVHYFSKFLPFGKGTIKVYWKGHGKVTLTRPFLMLDKVTFDEHALGMYWKGDISYTFIKGLTSQSELLDGQPLLSILQSIRMIVVFFL